MYMVVSRWEAIPGMEDEFRRRSQPVRESMRSQPGVVFLESIFDGKTAIAVHAYETEDAYRRIVQDPDGPFAKAVAVHRLEEVARFVGSERGETVE